MAKKESNKTGVWRCEINWAVRSYNIVSHARTKAKAESLAWKEYKDFFESVHCIHDDRNTKKKFLEYYDCEAVELEYGAETC